MGLWLVPCGIQHLPLTSSQPCSTPSFNRPALLHQTPCPAQQIQHPCGQLFPTQKSSLPSRAPSQLFYRR